VQSEKVSVQPKKEALGKTKATSKENK
jgi:hypothetical protein